MAAWGLEAMEEVATGATIRELDQRLLKAGLEEEEVLESLELDLDCLHLLFLRPAFLEVVAQEKKLPKCQVWVYLAFIKVDWCLDKGLVDVEFCLECPLGLNSIPNQLQEE